MMVENTPAFKSCKGYERKMLFIKDWLQMDVGKGLWEITVGIISSWQNID
jgi:hypothetical protein